MWKSGAKTRMRRKSRSSQKPAPVKASCAKSELTIDATLASFEFESKTLRHSHKGRTTPTPPLLRSVDSPDKGRVKGGDLEFDFSRDALEAEAARSCGRRK